MDHPGALLRFAQNELQVAAFVFMIVGCALRIVWILRFPAVRAGGDLVFADGPDRTPWRGGVRSLIQILLPWTMSSARQHPAQYFEFAALHLGIAGSIMMSLLIPYAPGVMTAEWVRHTFAILLTASLGAVVVRFGRRAGDPYVRSISTPDDYFTLAVLAVWFGSGIVVALGWTTGEWSRIVYFAVTAFLFVYTPFSKVLHYIYYPFARWHLGRRLAGYTPTAPAGAPARHHRGS